MISGMPRIAIAAADFDAMIAVCRDALGLPVAIVDASALGAKVAMCVPEGGSCIELMAPADPDAPLSLSLQRFLDKRGPGLFALMLEAPDPDAEAKVLSSRGLNVLPLMKDAGGRDVHPNSTCGTLIRVYPDNSYKGGRQPSKVTGIARVIMAVWDVSKAAEVYGKRFGLQADKPVLDAARGVEAVTVRPGTGGVIELVAVRDPNKPFAAAIAAHLKDSPEGMYALVLQATDPGAIAERLRSKGIGAQPAADDRKVVEVPRKDMFGALLRIEPAEGQQARASL
ncbi:hypothetical protein DFJ74DRAFT_710330 [Hyaloraphidium curvatum]|nr:hypothetical protein DFJ74DRAFT_710330 [Hyaloraphidium curvatum]